MPAVSRSAPRVWLEGKDPARPVSVPLRRAESEINIKGLIGLSPNEAYVTRLNTILTSGRWFTNTDQTAIILEEQMAARLGVSASGARLFSYGVTRLLLSALLRQILLKKSLTWTANRSPRSSSLKKREPS